MDKAKWVLIENEGAYFRGPSRAWPEEVWDPNVKAWTPYAGASQTDPKRMGWGEIISSAEFEADTGSKP